MSQELARQVEAN
jgi:hypothetical protein